MWASPVETFRHITIMAKNLKPFRKSVAFQPSIYITALTSFKNFPPMFVPTAIDMVNA